MRLKHFISKIKNQAGGHGSIVARIGAKFDPVQRITGLDKPSIALADKSNAFFSKIGTGVDRYASKLDPVRRIPIVDRVADQINKRPVDATAAAAGAYFGGSALYGLGAGGGAGGAGAGGAGGGATGSLSEGAFNAETAWAGGGGAGAGGGMGSLSWLDYLGMGSQFGGGLLSGAGQIYASNQAAKGDKAAIEELRRQYDINRADLAPYRVAGTGALGRLASLNGIGPDGNPTGAPADFTDFRNSPGYLANLREGLGAVENSAAARGGLYSGNAMRALQTRGADIADQGYGDYYNRLAALAGIGQTATNTGVQAGQSSVGQIAGLTSQAADTRASGIAGGFNAFANGLSGAGGYLYGSRRPMYGYGYGG